MTVQISPPSVGLARRRQRKRATVEPVTIETLERDAAAERRRHERLHLGVTGALWRTTINR